MHHQAGKKWPWPFSGLNSTKPAVMMASLLNFLQQQELVSCMHHLLYNIWSLESMPSDWCLSLLCPVLKKCDATICSNYRGITLLTITYRIVSSVLCERLKPFVNNWFLSVLFQTEQIHHRPELHATPNLVEDTG